MYNVFLSYSSQDIEWARYLKQLLTDAQANVFVAEYDVAPGKSLSDEISNRVKGCDLFLLLWSANSRASQYVQNEIFLAKAERKRILPLALQRGLSLPANLGDLKYLPLEGNPETALAWLKDHISSSASQKVVGDMVGIALMAFVGWAFLKGDK